MSRFMLALKTITTTASVAGVAADTPKCAFAGREASETAHGGVLPTGPRGNAVKTLVFDEIDTGIGGTMGLQIATKIAQISRTSQTIVVTHLAQIAAMADTHFLIEKHESENRTQTQIKNLDQSQQLTEIARMLGGSASTQTALDHAREMKRWCSDFKSKS
jgi:DNA repair protein RecN (Recombination protein N)